MEYITKYSFPIQQFISRGSVVVEVVLTSITVRVSGKDRGDVVCLKWWWHQLLAGEVQRRPSSGGKNRTFCLGRNEVMWQLKWWWYQYNACWWVVVTSVACWWNPMQVQQQWQEQNVWWKREKQCRGWSGGDISCWLVVSNPSPAVVAGTELALLACKWPARWDIETSSIPVHLDGPIQVAQWCLVSSLTWVYWGGISGAGWWQVVFVSSLAHVLEVRWGGISSTYWPF